MTKADKIKLQRDMFLARAQQAQVTALVCSQIPEMRHESLECLETARSHLDLAQECTDNMLKEED